MTPCVIRTTVGLALSVAGLVVLVPAPSLAAQPLQTHTLSCDDGTEVVLTVVEGNAFDVAVTNTRGDAVIVSGFYTPTA